MPLKIIQDQSNKRHAPYGACLLFDWFQVSLLPPYLPAGPPLHNVHQHRNFHAPIVILDEATFSIDPENKHALLAAIQELTQGKTLISIAHRLTIVRDAGHIVVIDQGRVAQQGTHTQLMEQDGIYQRFWQQRAEAIGWTLAG